MKPFPFRVTLFFILAFMLVIAAHPASPASNGVLAAAVYGPPAQSSAPDASTNKSQPVRTFPMTAFEHDVRRKMNFRVEWVSPREGRAVTTTQHRWHLTIIRRAK